MNGTPINQSTMNAKRTMVKRNATMTFGPQSPTKAPRQRRANPRMVTTRMTEGEETENLRLSLQPRPSPPSLGQQLPHPLPPLQPSLFPAPARNKTVEVVGGVVVEMMMAIGIHRFPTKETKETTRDTTKTMTKDAMGKETRRKRKFLMTTTMTTTIHQTPLPAPTQIPGQQLILLKSVRLS